VALGQGADLDGSALPISADTAPPFAADAAALSVSGARFRAADGLCPGASRFADRRCVSRRHVLTPIGRVTGSGAFFIDKQPLPPGFDHGNP